MFKERPVEIRQGMNREHGTLIGFGSVCVELSQGVGQYTTAIVILDSGCVTEVPVESIWVSVT